MDFHYFVNKKHHNRMLYSGYFLVGLAIALATTLLVYQAQGYDYDRKTNTIIQNGLILVEAQPGGAKIFLGDHEESEDKARITTPAGTHKITISKDGYQSWSKVVSLEGGEVKSLKYATLLYPTAKKLSSQNLNVSASVDTASIVSPDNSTVLSYSKSSDLATVTKILDNPMSSRSIKITPDDASLKLSSLSIVHISGDNKLAVFLQAQSESITTLGVIDLSNGNSRTTNINQPSSNIVFGKNYSYDSSRYNLVYTLKNNSKIFTVDLASATNIPLEKAYSCTSFWSISDVKLGCINTVNGGLSLSTLSENLSKENLLIRSENQSYDPNISTVSLASPSLVALANNSSNEVITYDLNKVIKSTDDNPNLIHSSARLKVDGQITQLKFSPASNYLLIVSDKSANIFDFKANVRSYDNAGTEGSFADSTYSWLDAYHLVRNSDAAKSAAYCDFDFSNCREIGAINGAVIGSKTESIVNNFYALSTDSTIDSFELFQN